MEIRATTCRNVLRGKTTFWLHDLGRSGERAVRRRSLMIKELPRSTLPLVFLATSFGPFCDVFAGHQSFAADTPTYLESIRLARARHPGCAASSLRIGDRPLLACIWKPLRP